LQRFFAKYEFCSPYLLCCSDCEPLTMQELLAAADEDSLSRYASALTPTPWRDPTDTREWQQPLQYFCWLDQQ
jgi:hypothetical protein